VHSNRIIGEAKEMPVGVFVKAAAPDFRQSQFLKGAKLAVDL
jgi:hypothetical protein